MMRLLPLFTLVLLLPATGFAQDAQAAAERARLANARIEAEIKARARAEEAAAAREEEVARRSGDAPLGAERARLAEARIRAEAEARAAAGEVAPADAGAPTDSPAAAQRARLADERIRAEAEARAAAAQSAVTDGRDTTTAMPDRELSPEPGVAGNDAKFEQAMQRIRTLGELRDAGYLTADEFERIKARILADTL